MVKAIIPFILFFSLILSVPVVRAQNVQSQSAKFNWLLRTIDVNYADSVNIKELTEAAMVKLLSELDPHSVKIKKSYTTDKVFDFINCFVSTRKFNSTSCICVFCNTTFRIQRSWNDCLYPLVDEHGFV